jgi:hypothetical protein
LEAIMKRSILHSVARIRPEIARGVMACALVALPGTPVVTDTGARAASSSVASAREAELGYTVRFAGVGAEGIDHIWRGPLGADSPGEITLRVEYRGIPSDAARPVWPVRVMAFVSTDDLARSFLAESDGTLNWTSGVMQLSGRVSEGWMKGASVRQTLRLDRNQFGGTGALRLDLATANR